MKIAFDDSLISLQQNILSPEQAIKLSGDLLAQQHICTPEYVDEMIKVYKDFGPAIVIDYGLAMPHARPVKGALKTGFSLVTTKNPVSFGHEEFDPVNVIIAIAGSDPDSHIKMIQMIAMLIEADIVTFLQNNNDKHSVISHIKKQMESLSC
jgi:PTS system ascorbate-specific IIA component